MIHIVDDGPAVTVGVNFLLGHLEAVPDPIEVVDVDQPEEAMIGNLLLNRLPKGVGGLYSSMGVWEPKPQTAAAVCVC